MALQQFVFILNNLFVLFVLITSRLLQAKAFLDDYKRTADASGTFDAKLSAVGSDISSEYADLLALSARQVMGSLDITLSKTAGGVWNFSDTKVFMKNMGSAGSDYNSTG